MGNREAGYYWVKIKGHNWWSVMYWGGSNLGWQFGVKEGLIQDIDERRIERPADPERVWYDHGVKK